MKSDRGCVLAAVRKHHQPQHAANTLRLGLRPQPRSGIVKSAFGVARRVIQTFNALTFHPSPAQCGKQSAQFLIDRLRT